MALEVYELTGMKTNGQRAAVLREWSSQGGVLVIGYEMYRNLTNRDNERIDDRLRSTFKRTLINPGPDLVVCDEGHLLKNETSALSQAMNRISTRRRIILTGTPLQNNLLEYHCMVQFVKPNLLGNKKEFVNRFANPIRNGQAADSNDDDVQLMKRRAHVLHKMLESEFYYLITSNCVVLTFAFIQQIQFNVSTTRCSLLTCRRSTSTSFPSSCPTSRSSCTVTTSSTMLVEVPRKVAAVKERDSLLITKNWAGFGLIRKPCYWVRCVKDVMAKNLKLSCLTKWSRHPVKLKTSTCVLVLN